MPASAPIFVAMPSELARCGGAATPATTPDALPDALAQRVPSGEPTLLLRGHRREGGMLFRCALGGADRGPPAGYTAAQRCKGARDEARVALRGLLGAYAAVWQAGAA
jgi:hypothetical protein